MSILFAIFEGIWRRAFGSGNFNRAILHIINVVATIFVLSYIGISWWRVVVVAPVFEFLFWSLGHGGAFDIGRSGYPDEETIKRYERFFWDKWCKFLVPKDCWYLYWYDYLWMMFRYGLPAILVSFFLSSWLFGYCGFGVATTYAICWSLYDKGKTKYPTELAEIISGLIVGFLVVC